MGDPDVELFYNDYNIEAFEPQKQFYADFWKKLKSDYSPQLME